MQLHILFDNPQKVRTNLDDVTGKVHLWLPEPGTITSVDVRLEGISATKIASSNKSKKPAEEVHKFHQQETRVWGFHQGNANLSSHYTIAQGNYEWPFRFKIPFNTSCHATSKLSVGYLQSVMKKSNKHREAPLPPSLGGFPDFAGVIYFVKVVVRSKDLFSKDPRIWQPISFLPLEAPRPPVSGGEQYARQHYRVGEGQRGPDGKKELVPNVKVDARLPSPGIVTCGLALPLKVIVERLANEGSQVFLQNLTVHLVGHTHGRVGDATEVRTVGWKVADHQLLGKPLFFAEEVADGSHDRAGGNSLGQAANPVELSKDDYWPAHIPPDVSPSFEVCNLKRWYDIDVHVGLSLSEKASKDNVNVVPLRLPCVVYSGISPSETFIYGARKPGPQQAPDEKRYSTSRAEKPPDYHTDPGLPSYPDALADSLGPIDGPRHYQPRPAGFGDEYITDEKKY